MIRVYGFSQISDWRFREHPGQLTPPPSPKVCGMDVRFSKKSDKKLFVESVQKWGVCEWDASPADDYSCRLMVTRKTVDELIRRGAENREAQFVEDLKKFQKVYFDDYFPRPLAISDQIWDWRERTRIMGILNVTPDSFSDGGEYLDVDHARKRARELEEAGADVLDIGGESTRPGAEPLSDEKEIGRVLPVLEAIRNEISIPISIDTTKASVAHEALRAGADMINDISGLRFDPEMAFVVAEFDVPVVVMHIRGNPGNMQQNPRYGNLMSEILNELAESRSLALQAGISPEKIIVDPGIGFGKQWFHNYQILVELAALKMLESPILIGPSRKSFLGKILNRPPKERLEGTLVASTIGILNGAHMIRVHDVKEALRAAKIADFFAGKQNR